MTHIKFILCEMAEYKCVNIIWLVMLFGAPNRGLVSNYLGYRGMANRLQATHSSQDVH